MSKDIDRTPIMVPKTLYKKFIRAKGEIIKREGRNISNHRFLEILLERAKKE